MSSTAGRPPNQNGNNDLNVDVPDDAPPPYSLASADQTVQAGPQRMDFSGPPPLPDRFQAPGAQGPPPMAQTPTGGQSIPGVGVGYGPTSGGGGGYGGYGGGGGGGSGGWNGPPPPSHPATQAYRPPPHPPQQQFSPPPSRPPPPPPNRPGSQSQDMTPTEAPTPGRPLLHKGQLLVYPKSYYCGKCQNTGYKQADPSRPCNSDWKKYGRPFTGALAHSYALAPARGANGTTAAATNFQRPLPAHAPPPPQQHYGGGGYGGYGGGGYGGGGWQQQPQFHNAYGPPPGALVLQPGDPRIGGALCQRCGGSGTEVFFLFDEQCRTCRGVGRVF